MLLALVFRGVAFEFRWRDPAHRAIWDFAFTAGSAVAAFTQGIALGALLQGIQVEGRAYAGGWWDWLTPFTLLTGASVVATCLKARSTRRSRLTWANSSPIFDGVQGSRGAFL